MGLCGFFSEQTDHIELCYIAVIEHDTGPLKLKSWWRSASLSSTPPPLLPLLAPSGGCVGKSSKWPLYTPQQLLHTFRAAWSGQVRFTYLPSALEISFRLPASFSAVTVSGSTCSPGMMALLAGTPSVSSQRCSVCLADSHFQSGWSCLFLCVCFGLGPNTILFKINCFN